MWKSYIPEVHAVLTQMRDPSTEMIAAADSLACAVDTAAQWQAMIDTAIFGTGLASALEGVQSSCL
ncbi:hypothetical protein HNO88_004082 [Novosphingobium chloroacetimidivorans]|uniref:Uncharacterized protein n=1 Tax=Novosphingobium chloroacetimidivorans TaxID=1428314 RepID=A0A7W7NZ16_9SPHN|nr:hypothetical protein [Novosphingobium chloroacetimidivorans]MBB4860737.1 hypothetical protein [Novosphingobium chloroacetimidivorans]